jgi:formylglycine-generating enzyme required for sulfatase activity
MKTQRSRSRANRFLEIVSVISISLLLGTDSSIGQDDAAKTADATLKRFVDECVLIKPGSEKFPLEFQMGRHFEGPMALPETTVKMSQPFRICKFETTQSLYANIMGSNPSRWKGARNSVESMTYADAQTFCTKLTTRLQAAKLIEATEIVRLPTEAEWEYCCRAGTDTRYSFGDAAALKTDKDSIASILNEYAWHTGNAAGNDPAVGVLKPNPWDLFDMHGYLWEYVSDPEDRREAIDKKPPATKLSTCIIRGGSWRDLASDLTCGARRSIPIQDTSDAIGFRCVIGQKSPES